MSDVYMCWFIISEWFNRITVYNKAVLYDAVENRPKDQALVTVSNHRSCFDDPVIWGNSPQYFANISESFYQCVSIASYANRWYSQRRNVRLSVCLSVRLSICLSHSGIVSKRRKLAS